ncbi:MAG: hypothetical protein J6Y91_06150 [Alphaproteobacteria bacterium]|nr:hypothetical protein [Alphaproteobacteria bacterium]
MEKVTVQDVRRAIQKVTKDQQTNYTLTNVNDDELFKSNVEDDLQMISGQMGAVIEQLSKDKHIHLPHELYKVLPNAAVISIVDTVNLCIKEATNLGIKIEE